MSTTDEELGLVLTLKQKQQMLEGLAQVRTAIKGVGQDTQDSGTKAQQSTSKWTGLQDRMNRFSGATSHARKVSGALFGVLVANSQGALGPLAEVQGKLSGIGMALEDSRHKAAKWTIGVGAALTGAGAVLGTIVSKEQTAGDQLRASITATGNIYDNYSGQVEHAIKTGEHYGDTAARTQSALNRLVLATHSPAEAFKLYNSVLQISAARHLDVESVALMMGRALHGQMRSLQGFGITVENTTALQKTAASAAKSHASALDSLHKAEQNLKDTQARINDAQSKGTSSATSLLSARVSLESATVALGKAQSTYGAGSGNAILASQRLTIAQQRYAQAQKTATSAGSLTLAQQISLRKAHEALATAQEKVMASSKARKKAQDEVNKAGSIGDQIQKQVNKNLAGQASAAANTFTGHMHRLAAVIDDKVAGASKHFYGTLVTLGPALMGVGAIMETGVVGKFAKGTKALVLWREESKIATGITKVWTAAQTVFNLVMEANPIMLAVTALVLLVAGFVIAYKKSKTFRDFIHAAGRDIAGVFKAVYNWFKNNWPLLLDILLGPFGFVLGWVIKNWNAVTSFFGGIIGWFESNWEYVLFPILMGPFGFAVAWVIKHWDGVVNFFKKLPHRIGDAFSSVGQLILVPFQWVFNKIAEGWNNTVGKVSFHVPSWVPGLGGKGFSMPKIPYWGSAGAPGGDSAGSGPSTTQNFSAGAAEMMGTFHTGGYNAFDSYINMKPGEEIVQMPGGATVVPINQADVAGLLGVGQGDIVIPVKVELDGKVLAESTFKYTRDKAARL